MGDIDNTLKTLADRHASDYVHWLLDASYKVVEKIGTELPKTTSRLADFVYLVEKESQAPFILHVEFQLTKSEKPMPFRMCEYNIRLIDQRGIPVCSTVIYLKEEADEGSEYRSFCPIDGQEVLRFRYNVIRMWEIDGRELLKRKMLGLYPLIGLTKLEQPEETFREVISEIKKIPDKVLAADVLFGFKLLAEQKHSAELLEALIRKEEIMESRLYREIYNEGKEEGEEKGRLETAQSNVQSVLTARFELPLKTRKQLRERITKIDDTSVLQELVVESARAKSFDDFTRLLDRLEV